MIQRVNGPSKVKDLQSEAAAKASLKKGVGLATILKFVPLDPKPSDLTLDRMKPK